MAVSRRDFLKTSAFASSGLVLGFSLTGIRNDTIAGVTSASPNAFLEIDSDNNITIFSPQSEMGQDVYTSMPMLIAEELEVDLQSVRVEIGKPGPSEYNNSYFGVQLVGASTSVRAFWEKLRRAGASARLMLINAAAQGWEVNSSSCSVKNGIVFGPGGQKVSYGEVAEAASRLEIPKEVDLKPSSEWKYIGNSQFRRLDTKDKVTGQAKFSIDTKLPGMRYAAIRMPSIIGATVVAYDDSRAKALPGVNNIVKLEPFSTFGGLVNGGVAVVAESYWIAKQALDLIDIKWDGSKNENFGSAELWAGMENASETPGLPFRSEGDVERGLNDSAKILRASYRMPFLSHAPMEPVCCTADVGQNRATIIVGHQLQTLIPSEVGKITGLKPEQIDVHTTFVGGGFGRKHGMDFVLQAAFISKASGVPVNLIWSREDDMTHDSYRPAAIINMEAGLDSQGKPIAMRFESTSPSISAIYFPPLIVDGIDPWSVEGIDNYPYDTPNLMFTYKDHPTPLAPGYFRSVSNNLNVMAMECFIDECALKAKKDPLEYRLQMLEMESKKYPLSVYTTGAGIATGARMKRALMMLKERSNWGEDVPDGNGRGMSLMEAYNTVVAAIVEVTVSATFDVLVNKVVIVADAGVIVRPDQALAQIEGSIVMGLSAALWGEVTVEGGEIQQTNFDTYRVARINEIPKVNEIHFVDNDGTYVGGLGEPVTAAVQPALGNAIFSACGKRVRSLPFTPENINGA